MTAGPFDSCLGEPSPNREVITAPLASVQTTRASLQATEVAGALLVSISRMGPMENTGGVPGDSMAVAVDATLGIETSRLSGREVGQPQAHATRTSDALSCQLSLATAT